MLLSAILSSNSVHIPNGLFLLLLSVGHAGYQRRRFHSRIPYTEKSRLLQGCHRPGCEWFLPITYAALLLRWPAGLLLHLPAVLFHPKMESVILYRQDLEAEED